MSEAQRSVSPIVAIAAVSVIVFSVVGVGVMTGMIPNSRSIETVRYVSDIKAGQGVKAKLTQASAHPRNSSPAAKPVPTQIAAVEPTPAVAAARPAPATQAFPPVPVAAAPVAPAPYVCTDCGVIET